MLQHVSVNYLITKQHGGRKKYRLRHRDNLAMIAFFCLHSTGAAISTEVIFLYACRVRKIWSLSGIKNAEALRKPFKHRVLDLVADDSRLSKLSIRSAELVQKLQFGLRFRHLDRAVTF